MSEKCVSSVCSVRTVINFIKNLTRTVQQDQIQLYAAQASFFILLSGLPFLMLLLSVSHYLANITSEDLIVILSEAIPADFRGAFHSLLTQLHASGRISLISVTAITALWSASRGMAALERGLGGVYRVKTSRGWLRDVLRSIIYTAVFIVLIFAALLLLVFGVQIADMLATVFPSVAEILPRLIGARGLVMFTILSVFFTLEHRVILKNAKNVKKHPIILPGALFSAAGWMLFSYFYSLYIRFFPRASYLFGSLTLLVILMLWLYCCMILLLAGAELNKILAKQADDPRYLSSMLHPR